ncbi:MAG: DUF3299 domain-containing protein [Burkholderiales bacterium]|nr:DUF3299 domain-containing protein [Burkholderiales bacterium]
MRRNALLALSATVLATAAAAVLWSAAGGSGALAQDPGFKQGDRLTAPARAGKAGAAYREISWEDLTPKDWDPMSAFKGLDLATLRDGDPRAMEALAKVQEIWAAAPVNEAMNNRRVRIAGFVVPLERRGMLVHEFLLVPYFGACIHTPPPPANQILHVFPAKPVNAVAMDPVWVEGALETRRSSTSMGNAGYRLNADAVTPYTRR